MFLLAVFSCCCKQTVRKTHLKCIKFELMNWQKSGEAVEAIEAMEQSTASCCQRQEGGGLRWLMARTCRMWASGAQSYWLMRGCQLRRNERRTGANLWIIQKSISNGPQTKDEQESHTLRRQKSKAKLELEMEMEDTGDGGGPQNGHWRCPDNGQEWQTIEPNMAARWQPNKKQLDSEQLRALAL